MEIALTYNLRYDEATQIHAPSYAIICYAINHKIHIAPDRRFYMIR